ncbi:MAG TPA: hypothetical protein PKD05_10985 [Candidatus Melainabacteria bacterium]|nr:hypothetical protein [Candidatus Melainabacteria bacterium]
MEGLALIPDYQPIPLPAPVWLLQLLLVLGFFLHAVPMNVVLGGGFVSSACLYLGRGNKDGDLYRMGKALATSLPLFISFAITQGIVPLLFLQLLYGPMFYTSSVLIAVPWLAVILLIIVAYYMSYWTIYKYLKKKDGEANKGMAPVVLLLMSFIFLGVAYLFVTNMTLMLHPERWQSLYQANQNGLNLPGMDVNTMARFLHFFLAGFAVTGLALGCFGLAINKRDEEFAGYLIKKGSAIYLLITLVQIGVGGWFLMSLPKEMMMKYMGQDQLATITFVVSMVFMMVSIVGTGLAFTGGSRKMFITGLVSALLTVLAMVVMRHQLRIYHLAPYVDPEKLPVSTQWDLLIVFIISAVALIAYLVWLARLVWGANNPLLRRGH